MMRTCLHTLLGLVAAWTALAVPCSAQSRLAELEEAAFRAAVERVAPSVVRIETVGGLEQVGKLLVGTGPTSGVIVSDDGYIISSAFNFANKPTTILVGLPDGSRAPARIVATDHARMLVLLKADVQEKLPVPTVAPEDEMQVGQWAIAVGRTFESQHPNMSVGIVSALHRIYGRALQTDAKISPNNYGGALIDVRGRVLGVLVPLSPSGNDQVSGVEWYDSGIGFAVSMQHIMQTLPRLKEGKDLQPGIMGVTLRGRDQFADPPVVAGVRANSPAYEAGLKPGDVIAEVAGKKVVRQSQVKEALGPYYAGDKVAIAFKRGDELIQAEMTLVDKLEPYTRPFLGILPMRVAATDQAPEQPPMAGEGDNQPAPEVDEQGVVVRYVYPSSPALKAGLEAGDRIVQADGKPVTNRAALRSLVANLEMKDKLRLAVTRGDSELNVEISPAQQPEEVPDKLPAAMKGRKPYLGQQPPVGVQPRKLAEFANEATIYVPDGYDPAVPHGMVIWFHGAGELQKPEEVEALIDRWKKHCDAHDLILVVPRSEDNSRWVPAKELPFAAKLAADVRSTYRIDDTRIVAAGYRAGAAMAWAFTGSERDLVRAVAVIDAPPISSRPPENDPLHPLSFIITKAEDGRAKPEQIEQAAKVIRNMKYPVTLIDQGASGRHLSDEELQQLIRWVDSLDRI